MNKITKIILTLVIALFVWQDNVFGQTGPRLIEGPTYYDTICSGITYTEHGFNYLPPSYGDFETSLTLPAANGEDSIVRLYLHVDRTYSKTRRRTICEGGSFHDYGFEIDNPPVGVNTYENNMTSIAGCDSTIILILTVTPAYNYTIEDYICLGESYNNYNFHFDHPEVGTYEETVFLSSWYECDSTVHLILHVSPKKDTTFYDTICSPPGYYEHGFSIDSLSPGNHLQTMHYSTTMGCDSAVILNLFVKESYNYDIYDTICFGEEYHNYNFHYPNLSAGDHSYSYYTTSVEGCDSSLRLHVRVNNSYENYFTDTIPLGSVYEENGFFVYDTVAGWHYDTINYETVDGCDSTNMLELYIAQTYYIGWFDTICFGENYNNHGFDTIEPPVGSDTIIHYYQTTLGFDSIITLNLLVNPTYDVNIYDTMCFGHNYDTLGFFLEMPAPGNHKDTLFLSSIDECDSIVWLFLHVIETSDTITIIDSIGSGSNYHLPGYTLIHNYPGHYTDTLVYAAASGCDSIVFVELYVFSQYTSIHEDIICYGEDYHYYDEEHDLHYDTIHPEPGHHTLIHQFYTTLGYDSSFRVNLYVANSYDLDIYDTICKDEGYFEYGFNIPDPPVGSINRTYSGKTVLGCDSILRLHLHTDPSYIVEYYDTICFGDSYNSHGFELGDIEPGYYYQLEQNYTIDGCDSTKMLSLVVNPTYNFIRDTSVCQNDYLLFHYQDLGYDQLEVIDENHILLKDINITAEGCDSIKELNVEIRPVLGNTLYDTICKGIPYNEHGFYIENPVSGVNFDSIYITSSIGCDSIALLQLYVMPTYDDVHFIDTICHGEVYNAHGFYIPNLNAGETHLDTLFYETGFGCDSIISLNLYVYPTYDVHYTDSICYGNGYHQHGFDLDDIDLMPGFNYDTLFYETKFGCDSTFSLELFVSPNYNYTIHDTICFGENYHNYNFDTVYPSVGVTIMQQSLTTPFGCDSVVMLNLYVGEVYDTYISDETCQGENYTINGFNISTPIGDTTIFDTLYKTSVFGCDSTVMLELHVSPTYITELRDTICHGEDYYGYGFTATNPPVGLNTLQQGTTTAAGCDSAVRLYLYVSPTYSINLYDSICFGENYDSLGFVFTNPEVGSHEQLLNLSTDNRCDSVVMMHLFVGEIFSTTFRDTICHGESYYKHNFKIENPEVGNELYTQSLNTIYGCDSIVNLRLAVTATYSIDVMDSVCEGEEYSGYGLFIHEDEYEPGYHDLESRLKTIYGCDSVYNLNLKVINSFETPQLHGREFVVVSTDLTTGEEKYYVEAIEGCNHYEWSIEYKWTNHNERWLFKPEHDTCRITVTTPGEAVLKVHASNSCSDVWQALDIRGTYFDVNEIGDINMTVYPNPCRYFVNIESKNIKEVNIINSLGIMLRKEEFNMDDKVTIDLTGLPSALYILEVVTSEGRGLKRITVDNN